MTVSPAGWLLLAPEVAQALTGRPSRLAPKPAPIERGAR
jgi:hypothetical protein